MKLTIALFACILGSANAAAEDGPTISRAVTDDHGILVHEVTSPYQAGKTQIRVLLPDKLDLSVRLPVIYVLPVEARNENHYGDGLLEIKKLGLHSKHRTIFVAPTFSHLPWYADHPTNPAIRQETYFLEVVLLFVEGNYPVQAERKSRTLLGFSKSGWGAWSLLLRHPDVFERAIAWDAPMMMDRLGKYGTGEIFGTQDNFEQYRIADLLRRRAADLASGERLILTGYDNFRGHHQQVHALLEQLGIRHEYRDGPQRKHDWHSGWVEAAVELLMRRADAQSNPTTGSN
jgi:S-formylglutathione hydrolase FrmB